MVGQPEGGRPPLPADALVCRQRAEAVLNDPGRALLDVLDALGWALLGIGAELAAQRRDTRRAR